MANLDWERRLCSRLNSPTLINDYKTPRGTIIGDPKMGFHVDLMQVWQMLRCTKNTHPLRWLNTYQAREFASLFENLFPEGSVDGEGNEILATSDFSDQSHLMLQFAEAFSKDPEFDDGTWQDVSMSCYVNPYLAHKYLSRVFPKVRHTHVACAPRLTFTYRGFTFRGTNDFELPLWDPIATLDDAPIFDRDGKIPKAIRKLVQSTEADPVKLSDIWVYGKEELNTLQIREMPEGVSQADQMAFLGLRPYPNSTRFRQSVLKENFKVMKSARERMVRSRTGKGDYILVTKEMCKFVVDALLLRGYISLPRLQAGPDSEDLD